MEYSVPEADMKALLQKQGFSLCIISAVGLALLFPELGSTGGVFVPEFSTQLGVWLIFLFQGLRTPLGELVAGYKPKRIHAFVLGWNFLLFPFLTGLLLWLVLPPLAGDLLSGFWFLSI